MKRIVFVFMILLCGVLYAQNMPDFITDIDKDGNIII